jgi:hypothetical protein
MKRDADFALGMALVSALLLSLAKPLWAKCPKNFVEVRGKLQCNFKPDYKVLITLIYSEHQREASREETALDIHDGSSKEKWRSTRSAHPIRLEVTFVEGGQRVVFLILFTRCSRRKVTATRFQLQTVLDQLDFQGVISPVLLHVLQ